MKITIESTTRITEVNGVPARIWEGSTETGIKVFALITRVAVEENQDPVVIEQFRRELLECRTPSQEVAAFPLRVII